MTLFVLPPKRINHPNFQPRKASERAGEITREQTDEQRESENREDEEMEV